MVKLITEIEKCVVRCSNCHRRKTIIEQGTSYKLRVDEVLTFIPTEKEKTGRKPINQEKVSAILLDWVSGEFTYRGLADKYDINSSTIWRAINKKGTY